MNDLILHQYAGSPFCEKVRLILGYKQLSWHSVSVPVIMPKPDVMALTGGYRRTPFLQIGADIYCDSALIGRVIDRLSEAPPLYPQAAGGLQHILGQWADSALFWTAVPYAMQPAGVEHVFAGAPAEFVEAFRADRASMTASMPRLGAIDTQAHLARYLVWLSETLADGRDFLLGAQPCIADFCAAHPIWFIRRAGPLADILQPHTALLTWYERVSAFGHGSMQKMSSSDAIALAAASKSYLQVAVQDGQGFEAGAAVTVHATDYGSDPVAGRLVGMTPEQVTIERQNERAGTLHVHFPRIGFRIRHQADTPSA